MSTNNLESSWNDWTRRSEPAPAAPPLRTAETARHGAQNDAHGFARLV
jgi:hypothetical protein